MARDRKRQFDDSPKAPRIPHAQDGEILGVVTEIFGGEHMSVKATDGVEYMGVIRGKIKKRMWCRVGDLTIISPWEGMSAPKDGKKPKAHIVWRYTKNQMGWLENRGYIDQAFMTEIQNI
jgi:translation initiation factor 1A